MDDGLAESVGLQELTVIAEPPPLTVQAAEAGLPFDVTVTVPVFAPAVAYVFDTLAELPESPSVPLQLYVYEPLPPEADAVHVKAVLPA